MLRWPSRPTVEPLLALALKGLGHADRARSWYRETYLSGGAFVQLGEKLGEVERGLEWRERARCMSPELLDRLR